MKILFVMLHPGYVRNFESVIRALSERGHSIHLSFNQPHKQAEDRQVEALVRRTENVTYAIERHPKRADLWKYFARVTRTGRDYLRYFDPRYGQAALLRDRVAFRLEAVLWRPLFSLAARWGGPSALRRLDRAFEALERVVPVARANRDRIAALSPDLVLVTPLVNVASDQTDDLKAAQALGIKTALCVASWDNLTNKGLIRVHPDRVIVWNETQKGEATGLHGVPEAQVAVTGAQCYDKWFEQRRTRSLGEFCQAVGLPADRPYLLYLCSSPFIAPQEAPAIERWIRRVRASDDPRLRQAGILVRPHPQNADQWAEQDFSHLGNVSIYPRAGANPVSEAARADFFESLFHAAAVVGVNTTSMIEAGILDKPVFTFLDPDFGGTQEGTLHFHYLVDQGLVTETSDWGEHLRHLSDALAGRDPNGPRRREFIRSFVRPHGDSPTPTAHFVDALEKLERRERPETSRLAAVAMRVALMPPAAVIWAVWTCRGHYLSMKRPGARRALAKAVRSVPEGILHFVLRVGWKATRALGLGPLVARRASDLVLAVSPQAFPDAERMAGETCRRRLEQIASSDRDVIVGPWVSEVGFELLYWIPFLNWALREYGIRPRRLVFVSRGGAEPWYEHLGGRYVDAFDYLGIDEFRRLNEHRIEEAGGQKQLDEGALDRRLVTAVSDQLGLEDAEVLHPSLMYLMFKPYWSRRASSRLIEKYTRFERLQGESSPEPANLPHSFVAVKFYFSKSFPDVPENRRFVSDAVGRLVGNDNVVILNTGLHVDDHRECEVGTGGRIHLPPSQGLAPRHNLRTQTEIIRRARLFVGTYGGFSYLAPLYGVPSISFYSREDQFLPVHLDIAHRACRSLRFGAFEKVKEARPQPGVERADFVALHPRMLESLSLLHDGALSLPTAVGGS